MKLSFRSASSALSWSHVVCVVLAGFALSCRRAEAAKPPPAYSADKDTVQLTAGAPRPIAFATAKAARGAPLVAPPITGRVVTVESMTSPAFAPLSGRVEEVRTHLGDHVQKGDRLVEIRAADLSTLHHDLRAADLAIRTKQAIVDRTKKLLENHVASESDLLVAESDLEEAKLAATSADAKIESLTVKTESDTAYWLLAPRSGTVVALDAAPGQQVGPDKDKPVLTIADLGEVLVVGDLRPSEAERVTVGGEATITFAGKPGAAIPGTIETISEVVDPDRQTVPLRVRVKNDHLALRPNAYVDVTLPDCGRGDVIEIPTEAVVTDGASSCVFVEKAPGTFARRPVQVGRQSKGTTEITTGLEQGESVVTEGALLLLNSLDVEG